MPKTISGERIHQDESIAEFCERNVFIRKIVRDGYGGAFRYEPVVMPHQIACDLDGYQYDMCGTEQGEPADGAQYKFYVGRNIAEAPIGGWQFIATAYREGDVILLDIEEAT